MKGNRPNRIWPSLVTLILAAAAVPPLHSQAKAPDVLLLQSQTDADRKSAGCLTCHTATDSPTMHNTGTVRLGCTDCHGGNPEIRVADGAQENSAQYDQARSQAHPQPRNPENAR